MTYVEGLIVAGKSFPGALVILSEQHDYLMRLAQEASDLAARRNDGNHPGWHDRFTRLKRDVTDCKTFSEVIAVSWKYQSAFSPFALGFEMFNCWEQSKGHWSVVSKEHKYYGAGMQMNERSKLWYATIIVGD